MNINEKLFLIINKGNPLLDNIMIFSAKYLIYFLIGFIIYLLIKKDKKAIILITSGLIGLLINQLISTFYYHPRPFINGLGKTLINHSSDSSFPSDHTTLALSLSLPLLFLKKTKIGTILIIISFLIGYSRVYCGVHYPYDIIGSFFVSIFSSIISYKLKDKINALFEKVIKKIKRYL